MTCNNSELTVDMCQKILLSPNDGAELYDSVDVAGVNCRPTKVHVTTSIIPEPSFNIQTQELQLTLPFYVVIVILVLLLLLAVAIIAG